MMNKIKGVIFDFNGTLFWDTPLHNKAWNIFLDKHHIQLTDQEKIEKVHGKNNYDIFTGIFDGKLSDQQIITLTDEKEQIYRDLCLETEMKLAPGAEDFLAFLTEIKLPITIATASEKDNVDFYFFHLPLSTYFDRSSIVFNDGTIQGKPHPEIFLKASARLNLKAEELVIFEDSFAGIKSAENAGAGNIIIVDSSNADYGHWTYPKIKSFDEVDRSMF